MSFAYPIMRSLDPYHARIGYLGALATVATRDLDKIEALSARYNDLLYEKIYEDDPRFDRLIELVPEGRRDALLKRYTKRPIAGDPSAILADAEKATRWHWVSEFWIFDEWMPSPLGFLPLAKRDRTIDLARWTGVLQPTLELSEVGYLLQYLLRVGAGRFTDPVPFNVLNPRAHAALPLLYLRLILEAEVLLPFLVCEFVTRQNAGSDLATRGEAGLLRAAVARMLDTIGEPTDPDEILEVRSVMEFRKSIEKKLSTEENYLRPRLEILVDLGFVGRQSEQEGKKSEFMWTVTETTRLLATEWSALCTPKNTIPAHLNRGFFASMARVLATDAKPAANWEQRLLWFVRAYREIGREFGFTPGRTLALLACLLAWEAATILEVEDVFDAVYHAAGTHLGRFLHFSGGSRFDREFLIRVDDDALPAVERAASA